MAGGIVRVGFKDSGGATKFAERWSKDGTTDGDLTAVPARAITTATGGSVTSANTWQSILAANADRVGGVLQNTGADVLLVYPGAPAAALAAAVSAPYLQIPAGGSMTLGQAGGVVLADEISITSPTTGVTYVLWVQ